MTDPISRSAGTGQQTAQTALRLVLSKRALSLFFRVGCERQFVLYLYNDAARQELGMPPRQGGRAGLGLVGRSGYDYQNQKIQELQHSFGVSNVILNPTQNPSGQFGSIDLGQTLSQGVQPYQFIVEGKFDPNTPLAQAAIGIRDIVDHLGNVLELTELQPDLIQVLPPLSQHLVDYPGLPIAYQEEVLPDGSSVPIEHSDSRLRLRVADVKLSSEPGAHYFAEVVFYSMALSAWLRDQGLHNRFAVIAAPAVVPGTVEDSALATQVAEWQRLGHVPSAAELAIPFEQDIEIAPIEAFAPRLRDLFALHLPRLLQQRWQDAIYHVGVRCKGCEFLGDPHIHDTHGNSTQHPLHCWSEADRTDALCRVFGLSQGASSVLRANQISDVPQLAQAGGGPHGPQAEAFSVHHGLRARRTIFPSRAGALQSLLGTVIPNSGGDALMPRWPNLHIYVFLDYDPATSFTVSLGCRAFWKEPLPFGSQLQAKTHRWSRRDGNDEVFIVDEPSVQAERREFLRFLHYLRDIMRWVTRQDNQDVLDARRDAKTLRSTYQIYLWDSAQRRHFVRLIGRHLPAILGDPGLSHLAWLFPPPELLANPEEATRRSPYTLVFDVVQNTVALPTPYHYTLFAVARDFNRINIPAPSVHPLYTESLSNLAPAERIHEYWRRFRHWRDVETLLIETAEKKLHAMGIVVASLERELRQQLSQLSAPPLPIIRNRPGGLAAIGYLWLEFTRLNGALESLDIDQVRAMPPHERETRFRSARLLRRLRGAERLTAIETLNQFVRPPLRSTSDLLIYELSAESVDFNARPGDFGYALTPDGVHGFLDHHPYIYTRNTPIQCWGTTVDEASLTSVTVLAVDRTNRLIALRSDPRARVAQLQRYVPRLDFSSNVILDPVHRDYLSQKVALTLQGIGNPPTAHPTPRVLEALGLPAHTVAGADPITPAAEVLWQPADLHNSETGRNTTSLRSSLEAHFAAQGQVLMPDQWRAWEESLSRRLALIWGPPGTGKTYTLRAVIMGAILDALQHRRSLRLLVTANTYTAVDNVLLRLHDDLRLLLPVSPGQEKDYKLIRIQSSKRPVEHDFQVRYGDIENVELNKAQPNALANQIVRLLNRAEGILVVGAPSQQLHNLAVAGKRRPNRRDTQQQWFDLIVVDEASQIDVATSTLVFSKRAVAGSVVLAGDDLQLPPIHQAEPPEDLEYLVGSIYNYMRHHQQIPCTALNISFRANDTLVAFTREAGYDRLLRAHSPQLKLNIQPILSSIPQGWPASLPWEGSYGQMLDPDHPAVCVIHDDRLSAQASEFEANRICALAWLLRTNVRQGLLNELDAHGQIISDIRYQAPAPYTAERFWEQGIGIVVPHRAQMSLVVAKLQALFPHDPQDKMRGAVDTVERFQGQERDVILGSFGLGDPDLIAAEEEFLYSLRRFNVMSSRARAKLVVLVTRSLIEHLADDREILRESLLLKKYAEQFCLPAPEVPGHGGTLEIRWR